MRETPQGSRREIIALKVHQWLEEWNKVEFDEKVHRRQPDPHFYVFILPASELKALSGISRRTTEGGLLRAEDLGIQRQHDKDRSKEIHKFVKYGYPWSELAERKRQSGQFDNLRKPGWLPTSIVVNILKPEDTRRNKKVAEEDIITVVDSDESTAKIRLPDNFSSEWKPREWRPIEVIDGQHRLWAFEEDNVEDDIELPVVAFHGLDISWQAYLFWTINIKPKRINASLAFDLYPLLRTEDWLEKFHGHSIYRETRAQELVEAIWAHPKSPWYHRINMLGETGLKQRMVTQAAWIRSLMATYIKSWENRRVPIGGLFGAHVGTNENVLPWSRSQQAAFLIFMGQCIRDEVKNCNEDWAIDLREGNGGNIEVCEDLAFCGQHTLLNTDQGTRGLLYVTNDLCYINEQELELENWYFDIDESAPDMETVDHALESIKNQKFGNFLNKIAEVLSKYDWRTSGAKGLNEEIRQLKARFRGAGGYKEIRVDLIKYLESDEGEVGRSARDILKVFMESEYIENKG